MRLFFTYFTITGVEKENRSLYRGCRYIEVRYIEVPPYLKKETFICLITGQHTSVTQWQSSWPRCQPSARCWGQTSQWTAGFDSASYSVCTRTQPTMWWIQKHKSSGTVFSPSLRRVKGNACLHWTTNRIVIIRLYLLSFSISHGIIIAMETGKGSLGFFIGHLKAPPPPYWKTRKPWERDWSVACFVMT